MHGETLKFVKLPFLFNT